jgi:hypothetical protein
MVNQLELCDLKFEIRYTRYAPYFASRPACAIASDIKYFA